MSEVILGSQGWVHPAWVGPFYPARTTASTMLECYATAFKSVELDSTFHEMPANPVVRDWRRAVPDEFEFAVRVPRQITHERRLVDTSVLMKKFLDRISAFGECLGPVFLQFPSDFGVDEISWARFQAFTMSLSEDFRWVIEFRNAAWFKPETYQLLSRRNIAVALVDGRWMSREAVAELAAHPTADFAYVRWLGSGKPQADYSRPGTERAEDLSWWASILWPMMPRVTRLYGYFSNSFEGHAPHSARVFQRMMGVQPVDPQVLRLDNQELSRV